MVHGSADFGALATELTAIGFRHELLTTPSMSAVPTLDKPSRSPNPIVTIGLYIFTGMSVESVLDYHLLNQPGGKMRGCMGMLSFR